MDDPQFRRALDDGLAAHRAGDLLRALASYRAALQLDPQDAEALSLYGLALTHLGRPHEAVSLLRFAVEREPLESGFKLNLATCELALGHADSALGLLQAMPSAVRERDGPRALTCEALVARADWSGLYATAASWSAAQPDAPQAWRHLSRASFELGRHADAAKAYAALLQRIAPTAAELTAYAGICLHALDLDAAERALGQAEAIDPQYPPFAANRALLAMYRGDFPRAQAYAQQCVRIDPDNVPAYSILSRLNGGALSPSQLQAVTSVARAPDAALDRRIPAAFVAAHAHDAQGEVAVAFAAYQAAHALAIERDTREGRRYDPAAAKQRMQRIIDWTARLPRSFTSPSRVRPIFVVGMPRSGTTLIESVLAAHSCVFAGGERVAMRQLLQGLLDAQAPEAFDAALAARWSLAYLGGLTVPGNPTHLTDKHPLNFEAVGLIAQLFPEASIVHVRRDPMETGLSIYRQEFNKLWTFAHRFQDIAHHYALYAQLMAHWERVLPDRVLTVQYETFVAQFDASARELVEHCGLAWEPQSLEFQTTERAISTFSAVQVRGPVKSGNGRASRYASQLSELRTALEEAGIDLRTGALR